MATTTVKSMTSAAMKKALSIACENQFVISFKRLSEFLEEDVKDKSERSKLKTFIGTTF